MTDLQILQSKVQCWYLSKITGGQISAIGMSGTRHFTNYSPVTPGARTYCGLDIQSCDDSVKSTCETCSACAYEEKVEPKPLPEPVPPAPDDSIDLAYEQNGSAA